MEDSVSCLVDGLAVCLLIVTMNILDAVIIMLDMGTIITMSSALLVVLCLMMYYLVNKNFFAGPGIIFLGILIRLYSVLLQLKRAWMKPCDVKTCSQGM